MIANAINRRWIENKTISIGITHQKAGIVMIHILQSLQKGVRKRLNAIMNTKQR